MSSTEGLRAAGRLAVLAAVGLSLVATSRAPKCKPLATEQLDYDVASDCGPGGPLQLFHQGDDPGADVCHPDDSVVVTGGAAVGLPDQGHLIDAQSGEDPRGIAAGDFVLAGEVDIPGAVPPITAVRVCRFTPDEATGTLALVCIGPAPEAACSGTLTPAVGTP